MENACYPPNIATVCDTLICTRTTTSNRTKDSAIYRCWDLGYAKSTFHLRVFGGLPSAPRPLPAIDLPAPDPFKCGEIPFPPSPGLNLPPPLGLAFGSANGTGGKKQKCGGVWGRRNGCEIHYILKPTKCPCFYEPTLLMCVMFPFQLPVWMYIVR